MVVRLSSSQIIALQARHDWNEIDEIAGFLLAECEAALFDSTSPQVFAAHAYHRGKKLGLRKKPALKQFAFLVVETGLQALTAPEIEAALTQPGVNPDAAMDEIMRVLALSCAE